MEMTLVKLLQFRIIFEVIIANVIMSLFTCFSGIYHIFMLAIIAGYLQLCWISIIKLRVVDYGKVEAMRANEGKI